MPFDLLLTVRRFMATALPIALGATMVWAGVLNLLVTTRAAGQELNKELNEAIVMIPKKSFLFTAQLETTFYTPEPGRRQDVWQYVGQAGRRTDAIAYYTSLGGAWDLFWAAWLATRWRVLTTAYFEAEVAPKDPLWPWLRKKTGTAFALTVYRASAFFGVVSIIAWMLWALFVNDFQPHLDWTLGGPSWAPRQGPP